MKIVMTLNTSKRLSGKNTRVRGNSTRVSVFRFEVRYSNGTFKHKENEKQSTQNSTIMNNLRKRIVVIENDQKFKELLCGLIESTGTYLLTNTYSTCELASAQIKRDFPDVIVMGLEFPEMKGTDCISELKNILPHTNILVVSDYEDEEIVIESFMAGANGYLLKKSCLPKFTEYLSEFSTGGSPLSPFIAKILVDSIHRAQVCPLTPREIQVLKLITQGNTYSAIAQELNISKETSKTHIRNIYKKLNVRSKAEVIRLAFKEHFVPYVSVKAA